MAWSMPSEDLQLMVAGYVLGDLDPDEATEFEQLLDSNPAIAQEVAQMQKALELSYTPIEVEPPAHLRLAIMNAGATKTRPWHTSPASSQKSGRNSSSWGRAMGAVAAVLIVALAVNNYQLRQTLQATQIEQFDTLTYSLEGTETAEAASATVVVNPNTLEAELSATNLPPLPSGKVYVLWTVVEQGAPFTTDAKSAILTEVLDADAEGNIIQTMTVPEVYRSRELVSRVAVTVEDAVAPQNHEGKPVMITSL